MSKLLHIDIETYSSVDISAGVYAYAESPDFMILMIAYAFGDGEVKVVDLTENPMPQELVDVLEDDGGAFLGAHNATFERVCLLAAGYWTAAGRWRCTMVQSAYCGLPLSLGDVAKALKLPVQKATAGKALIRYFSIPCKPTKANGGRRINLPENDPEKWAEFMEYCRGDVEVEREIHNRLSDYKIPVHERILYAYDQVINDYGIHADLALAEAAQKIDKANAAGVKEQLKQLTGLDNPNSPSQLKEWLSEATGKEITTLAKNELPALIECASGAVRKVLELRQRASKTSIKKYKRISQCVGSDGRVRGLFQFYGANRTGRWAGRMVQMQNLPRNYLADLDEARNLAKTGDLATLRAVYPEVSDTLSQLIRTAFVAKAGHSFVVADFSAIEARVIAWLAGEEWRLEVFRTHGKIYEASAAMMFDVPLDSITKGSDLRARGKVAELALGYGGSVGALTQMMASASGLDMTEAEKKDTVKKWRKANTMITQMWKVLEAEAIYAVTTGLETVSDYKGITFNYDGSALRVKLPSGRELFYWKPLIGMNRFNRRALKYWGMENHKWSKIETYGGKLTENIVQAIARDLLADTIRRCPARIVMHVHDEVVCEVPDSEAEDTLQAVCEVMSQPCDWCEDLPLGADGYVSKYYKKD